MKHARNILTRHPANPIISTRQHPEMFQIFNPTGIDLDGQTIMTVSMVPFASKRNGYTYIARSDDGVHFDVDTSKPFFDNSDLPERWSALYHFIDNRITRIGDTYYILTPCASQSMLNVAAPITILGKTTDFKTYQFIEAVGLMQRGASLFPEKINGKYVKLDRPGAGDTARGSIWLSESPDLVHWGAVKPVAFPGQLAKWTASKLGPTPPIKTSRGWLEIIHGVYTPCDGPHYFIGACLLDLDDPTQIIGHTSGFLLAPEEPYETNGVVDNVVFPCGAIADEATDEFRMYYGAADTCVCLATGSLGDILDACENHW